MDLIETLPEEVEQDIELNTPIVTPEVEGDNNLLVQVDPDPGIGIANNLVMTTSSVKVFACTNQSASFKSYRGTWINTPTKWQSIFGDWVDQYNIAISNMKMFGSNPKLSLKQLVCGENMDKIPNGWYTINFEGYLKSRRNGVESTYTQLRFDFYPGDRDPGESHLIPNDGRDHTFHISSPDYGLIPPDIDVYTGESDAFYFSPNFHLMVTYTPIGYVSSSRRR